MGTVNIVEYDVGVKSCASFQAYATSALIAGVSEGLRIYRHPTSGSRFVGTWSWRLRRSFTIG